MEDRIINRGKDWFAFRKGMDDFIVRYDMKKRRGGTKTKGLVNDTAMAPHSPQKNTISTRI